LDELGHRRTVGGYGAHGRLLILSHEAAVTFDISTEDSREPPLKVLCGHENTSWSIERVDESETNESEK
jgi:hypothetical protein